MVRKWLVNLFARWLAAPTPEPLTAPVDVPEFTQEEAAELVAPLSEHPGFQYIAAVFHNRRAVYELEQSKIVRNLGSLSDAEADWLVRRLIFLDAAIAENRWMERQIENAAKYGKQVSTPVD